MTAAKVPADAWMEKALVTIAIVGGSNVEFWSLTETIDFDGGDKDINGVALVNGGRIIKWDPQTDIEVTMEAYPLYAGTTSGTVGKGFFDLINTGNTTAPLVINNDYSRQLLRVAICWTNDTSMVSAAGASTATYEAMRITLANAVCTSVKPSFTDGILKFTCKFKCVPFTKAAANNFRFESCEGASGDNIPVLGAYTSSNNF